MSINSVGGNGATYVAPKKTVEQQEQAKKVAIGIGVAATGIAAATGLVVAAKKGKLGTTAQENVNKLFESAKKLFSKKSDLEKCVSKGELDDAISMDEFKKLKQSGDIKLFNSYTGEAGNFEGKVIGKAKNGNQTILEYTKAKDADSVMHVKSRTFNKDGKLINNKETMHILSSEDSLGALKDSVSIYSNGTHGCYDCFSFKDGTKGIVNDWNLYTSGKEVIKGQANVSAELLKDGLKM